MVEEVGELRVQCLHRHSHTNRTLDSLNTVNPPPPPVTTVPPDSFILGNCGGLHWGRGLA